MNRTKQMYEEDREYLDCVEDILEHPVFRSMDQYIQHGETTCKDHCIQVSYRAYQTCRKHGWDWRALPGAACSMTCFCMTGMFRPR